MVLKYNKVFSLGCRSRLISAGLHQAMRLTFASPYVARWSAVDFRSLLSRRAVSSDICCRISLPLFFFFACGHPASGMPVTPLPVAVVRVKCYVQSFFVPPCVPGES